MAVTQRQSGRQTKKPANRLPVALERAGPFDAFLDALGVAVYTTDAEGGITGSPSVMFLSM